MEPANLIYTCYAGMQRIRETLVPNHTLTMVVARNSRAYFNEGEILPPERGSRFMKTFSTGWN
jgi:hypothetical protein